MSDPLRRLARRDRRYSPEAFRFLFEALEHTVRMSGKEEAEGLDRHVSGQEVLSGIQSLARERFGPLAADVWRSWGIHESMDWGRIVFLLVEEGLLKQRPEDSIEDFRSDLDFDEAFVRSYRPELPPVNDADPGEAS